ncbi:MAG: hypothetical protein ACFFD1_09505 [Candidatus Thorarchaeota archaeon]
MLPIDQNSYRKVLKIFQRITLETNIQTLSLVKDDGSNIAFFSEIINSNSLETQTIISAMISSISTSAKLVCDKLKYGNSREIIIRGSSGYTIFFIAEIILIGGGNYLNTLAITLRVFRYYFPQIYSLFYPEWSITNKKNLDV